MSYDADMVIDTGGEYPASVCDMGNYTWNVNLMYARAFAGSDNIHRSLYDMNGLTGARAQEILSDMIGHMSDPANQEEYEALNPDNGWGNHQGAIRYLKNVLAGCREHPAATLKFS